MKLAEPIQRYFNNKPNDIEIAPEYIEEINLGIEIMLKQEYYLKGAKLKHFTIIIMGEGKGGEEAHWLFFFDITNSRLNYYNVVPNTLYVYLFEKLGAWEGFEMLKTTISFSLLTIELIAKS